jgi:NAD(P)-dependent dehydrogenase (short-subunit alcohol dehydrogenase family)
MQRIGDPGEVAEAAVFLAADESRYATGSELVVDVGAST